jgi:polyhydroxybutyrate depolymerase
VRFTALTALLLSCLPLALVPVSCGSDGGSSGGDDAGDEAASPALDGGALRDTGTTAPDGAPLDGSSVPSCTGKTGAGGDRTVTITSGGLQRSFDLHVPPKYDPTRGTPLVFMFHGYSMTAASIAAATHFSDVADARTMIVAYPTGTGPANFASFNAGDCCGTAASSQVDDVGFTRDMLSNLEADYCVDPKRVFSTGLSNGGFFSYTLACELSDKIAAVAPVAGVLGVAPATCAPSRPVPVLHIHGTGDVVVPYGGGVYRSVGATVDAWKAKDTCAPADGGAGTVVYTKGDVSCTSFGPCAAGSDVELCTVTGGGHQWPGGSLLPYGGSPTPNLIASEAIADFFQAHAMP